MAEKLTKQQQLQQAVNRLETLSLRERAMLLVGLPVALAALCEVAIFAPAQKLHASARKQAAQQTTELQRLQAELDRLPLLQGLPAASQLQVQRDQMQQRIATGDAARQALGETTDWGSVVRNAVVGAPGLALTQLRTLPAETVFSASTAVAAALAASAPKGKPKAPAKTASAALPEPPPPPPAPVPEFNVYRHRAELTVQGNFEPLLGYLQSLQRAPGELRWDKVQLNVANYPAATLQLSVYTLSVRPDTPFN